MPLRGAHKAQKAISVCMSGGHGASTAHGRRPAERPWCDLSAHSTSGEWPVVTGAHSAPALRLVVAWAGIPQADARSGLLTLVGPSEPHNPQDWSRDVKMTKGAAALRPCGGGHSVSAGVGPGAATGLWSPLT